VVKVTVENREGGREERRVYLLRVRPVEEIFPGLSGGEVTIEEVLDISDRAS